MQFRIDPQVLALAPDLRIGVLKLTNFSQNDFSLEAPAFPEDIMSPEPIKRWIEVFSSFGAKHKKTAPSVLALLRRLAKGETLPSVSPLVDIYNNVSVEHICPVGGDDLAGVQGNIHLTRASGEESFLAINSDEVTHPRAGEVIYKDDSNVLCRRWNWRECDQTKLTLETKEALLYVEGFGDYVQEALDSLTKYCEELLDGTTTSAMLSADANVLDIDSMTTSKDYDDIPQVEQPVEKKLKKEKKKDKPVHVRPKGLYHWADQTAQRILDTYTDRDVLTLASGITPSGVVHIGNFREIITVELVFRALKKLAPEKNIRFIYSWDDYDKFRKVPKNMPEQEMLGSKIGLPTVNIPDPFGTAENYARHHELEIEHHMPQLGIAPDYIYQANEYRAGKYVDGVRIALENESVIRDILNEYRKEPLSDEWSPVVVFDPETNMAIENGVKYKGGTLLEYEYNGQTKQIDFSQQFCVKLRWRIDWPMRWKHEGVVFEPGGKDHSSVGGSFDTGKLIADQVYNYPAPLYIMYDFIRIKGGTGKISSSSGDVITIADVLKVYEPMMVRWLFAGTKVGSEFAISFDEDVIKIYEDFDKCEQMYYGKIEAKNEKEKINQTRIYELSCVEKVSEHMPFQPSFRHLTTVVQIFEHDISKVVEWYAHEHELSDFDKERVALRASCASEWLRLFAPEEHKFSVNATRPDINVDDEVQSALHKLVSMLDNPDAEVVEKEFFAYLKQEGVNAREFFKVAYSLLISREKGPKLVPFIYTIGVDRVKQIFS